MSDLDDITVTLESTSDGFFTLDEEAQIVYIDQNKMEDFLESPYCLKNKTASIEFRLTGDIFGTATDVIKVSVASAYKEDTVDEQNEFAGIEISTGQKRV